MKQQDAERINGAINTVMADCRGLHKEVNDLRSQNAALVQQVEALRQQVHQFMVASFNGGATK